jgi:hypothetical protein
VARIPNALEMKALKYGDRPAAERDQVALLLRAEGRRSEAILLFDGRPDHPFLAEERTWAIGEGAAFHLLSLRRMGLAVSEADLRACAAAAEGRGRWLDARQCWVAVGDLAPVRRIAEHLPTGLRPPPEEPPPTAQGP